MLLNTITNDQFCLKRTQHNLNFSWDALRKRACYNIPNTPHVILATKKQALIIWKSQLKVHDMNCRSLFKKLVPEHVKVINQKICKNFLVFDQKVWVLFNYTKMVRVTRNSNIILWINSDYLQTNPEFPLRYFVNHEAYKNAVFNVLSLFQDAGFKKFYKI